MPSSLAAQIASARAVVATLPPEILASVQLEGFDRFPATAPDVAKDAARLENMPNLIADFIEDNWKMKKYSLEEIGIGVRGLDLAAMGALPPTDSPTTTKAENDNS